MANRIIPMTDADWWARAVQARTQHADLLPQRVGVKMVIGRQRFARSNRRIRARHDRGALVAEYASGFGGVQLSSIVFWRAVIVIFAVIAGLVAITVRSEAKATR